MTGEAGFLIGASGFMWLLMMLYLFANDTKRSGEEERYRPDIDEG